MGKGKHKISTWKQYNQVLVNRSSVTFWINVAAIKAWHYLNHHGRGFIFSDTKIEPALTAKDIFRLLNRGLEGFFSTVLTLMDIPLKFPTYTCISKRSKTVELKYRLPRQGAVAHVVIDTTGRKGIRQR
ncbi:Mobile element protein [Candidatus Enterovibrio escicola]|uniref:Mobile element protein n=1 Tax=Candidatus Enterovibrio escicola TaxID=1927127 RepID=A0A2A5T1H6_9GAMM|nr:Mobile element protein [Candidatus Enterovibrio escacola]